MSCDHVVACYVDGTGHQEYTVDLVQVPDRRSGGEILLGVVNGESTMDRAILVQSCDHIPNRAAWMAGGYVMGDGALHMITPADPLLFLIPSFPSCPKQAFSEFHFCDMEELFASQVPHLCQFLLTSIEPSQLSNICDTKSVDGQLYYRYSFARIIAWLQCKTEQTLQALKETCPRVLSQEPGSDMLYATTLLTECLSVEWEKYLIQSLGLVSSSLRPPKRDALENQSRLPEKVAKVEKQVVLSSKQKAALSREASKAAAFSKVSKGSAKIASFFTRS